MALSLFTHHLFLLQAELSKKTKQPLAEKIYQSQARNLFFRLEALCRMFKQIHDKDLFKSLQEEFKLLEDALGLMDYYDGLRKNFSEDPKIPTSFLKYFSEHFQHASDQLTLILKDIPIQKATYIHSVLARLEKAKWLSNATQERSALATTILHAIEKLEVDYKIGKLNFLEIEKGLHEFRRRLRWISIYVAATDGLFQLRKSAVINADLRPYLTEEIVSLPYNKMPPVIKGSTPVYIESQNFYALSWLIQELGKLKDDGLKHLAINEVFNTNKLLNKKSTLAMELHKSIDRSLAVIPSIAQNITDDFLFKHGVLARIKRDIYRSLQ